MKLAATPKSEQESTVIMMSGIHSKIVFSSFAASKLKKKIEKEKLKNQYGFVDPVSKGAVQILSTSVLL